MGPWICSVGLEKKSTATRMSAAKQLLEALENLHKAGFVRHGEKFPVFFKQTIPIVNLQKQEEPASPTKVPESLRTEDFYLGDFGLAIKLATLLPKRAAHPHSSAPKIASMANTQVLPVTFAFPYTRGSNNWYC